MLFGTYEFFGLIKTFRVAAIMGRFGSGKTAISWKIAHQFLSEGHAQHMVANFPAIGQTYPIPHPLKNSVLLVDEFGSYVRSGAEADTYFAALRKLNNYVITPSIVPPPRQMGILSARRILNLYRLGVPVWIYQWKLVDQHYPQKGFFHWFNPVKEFGGAYDTDYFPVDDWGIQEGLMGTVMRGRKPKETKRMEDYRK